MPAGLGREINSDFIEGFIAETRARKPKAVLQTLVVDPSLISAYMVEEVLKFKRLDGSEAALRRIADANFAGGAQSALFSAKLRDNRPSKATPPAATAEKDQGQPVDDAELVKHPKMGQIFRRAGVHVANVG
jgi:hypothetical protein